MGPILSALLRLQGTERDLAQLRRRMKTRQNAVSSQEQRITALRDELDALRQSSLDRRKQADSIELDLRQREEHIEKLRVALNSSKTNKEYASILTQINTSRADNAKLEEQALKILSDVDTVKAQAAGVQEKLAAEQARLQEIKASNAAEIEKLQRMIDDLTARRTEAAQGVSPDVLSIFEKMASRYDGEAMAPIDVTGRRPPLNYTCGGCYMSLNAEHANVLKTRDEIRQCDNCQRILYMAPENA